jgi:ABC-type bacteriocin/lantibiotic exporter with double-glycine peptidase domain
MGGDPVIAHMKDAHFVVVVGATYSHAYIFDPAHGATLRITRLDFENRWDGKMMILQTDLTR